VITAELIHKTDVAYAWVEVDRTFDRDAIAAAVDRFSRNSYPLAVAFFGSEWNPGVDNDPRLHILHAYGLGSGIAGYYSSADQYSRLAREFSNEKEMFYISLSWLNSSKDYTYYETVLAHELQHMIHWYRDRNEATWVNEGLSEYAQEVAGYDPDTVFARTYISNPDTQLNTWADTNNGVHYGNAYLFTTYFAQRFGPEMTRALVAEEANGLAGYEAVLSAAGMGAEHGYGVDALFADWVVANYVDDSYALGLDNVYGYGHLDFDAPVLDQTHDRYPVEPRATDVKNYAVDYILLKGSGRNTQNITVEFNGATTTRLAAVDPYSGRYSWWSNRGDDINPRLTRRFDLSNVAPGTPVEMTAALWWNIELDYDYAYVAVSRDGVKWHMLESASTTAHNPSGNSFGPGYTGLSGGGDQPIWVEESYDLSAYAGEEIFIRFEFVGDDAVNKPGLFLDDLRIPAIGYADDFEGGPQAAAEDGWESEGWLLIDNQLPQRWLLQVLIFQDNRLVDLERPAVDENGYARIEIDALGGGKTAVLAISALAPVTTEPAAYEYWIETRP
jgi:immune inhibitor A